MTSNELSNYMKALKSKPIKNISIKSSKRKQAWDSQEGRCAVCKKDLKTYYSKYIEDKKTKTIKVLCSGCAIKTVKKH